MDVSEMKLSKQADLLFQFFTIFNSKNVKSQLIDPVLILADTINKTCQAFPKRRLGQNVFNVLYEHFPEVINELRGGSYDCFYNNDKVVVFISMWLKIIQREDIIEKFTKKLFTK
jgi:hypothetical protein